MIIVIAVGAASGGLHHSILSGHVLHGLVSYAISFFMIWLAWLNFSWFASAYDTDDTRYRIITFVQMVGAVVLAVGIHDVFQEEPSYVVALVGYIIMRIAMVSQWLRAAREHAVLRKVCLTYAVGILIAQVCWIGFVFLPVSVQSWLVFLLMAFEIAIPYYAEKRGQTPWHPHHIAERYGLLVIITLGECLVGTVKAIASVVHEGGVMEWIGFILPLSFCTMALAFVFWWIYFSHSYGDDLMNNRSKAFLFGYIHYFIFAALAALGTGMELLADAFSERISWVFAWTTLGIASAVYLSALLLSRIRSH